MFLAGDKMRRALVVTLALCGMAGIGAPLAAVAQAPIPNGPSSEKDRVVEHKDHPTPSPSAGKALVYVTIGGYFGKTYQGKMAVNGTFRAVLEKNQYTFFEADPGVLKFHFEGKWAYDKAEVYLVITAQADQTYYVSCESASIQEVDVAEGKSLLAKRQYVTFEVQK
jgi:hypothetical protein